MQLYLDFKNLMLNITLAWNRFTFLASSNHCCQRNDSINILFDLVYILVKFTLNKVSLDFKYRQKCLQTHNFWYVLTKDICIIDITVLFYISASKVCMILNSEEIEMQFQYQTLIWFTHPSISQ